MRVYLDTEFTQFTYPRLIGIGLVADNGREFYAVLKGFPLQKCSVFVREVVLPIIEHWPSTTLDRSELRQSLKQWLSVHSILRASQCFQSRSASKSPMRLIATLRSHANGPAITRSNTRERYIMSALNQFH